MEEQREEPTPERPTIFESLRRMISRDEPLEPLAEGGAVVKPPEDADVVPEDEILDVVEDDDPEAVRVVGKAPEDMMLPEPTGEEVVIHVSDEDAREIERLAHVERGDDPMLDFETGIEEDEPDDHDAEILRRDRDAGLDARAEFITDETIIVSGMPEEHARLAEVAEGAPTPALGLDEPYCDHVLVAVMIARGDEILLMDSDRPPYGWTFPIGHKGPMSEVAAATFIASVGLGLRLLSMHPIYDKRMDVTCSLPHGDWHRVVVFRALTTGAPTMSQDDLQQVQSRQMQWLNRAELKHLGLRAAAHKTGVVSEAEWEESPGLALEMLDVFLELELL